MLFRAPRRRYIVVMINIAFAFNFNIQRCEVEVGEEEAIVRLGYRPLIRLLLRHGLKADLFVSGFSTLRMLEIDPGLVESIRGGLGRSFALGTYTYTHPIPQLLGSRELEEQIARGLAIDRRVYGVEPEGFLPPELAYSDELARILSGQGIRWVIVLAKLLASALPPGSEESLYRAWTAENDAGALTALPAAYRLPGTPERFFKRMMKGELAVDTVIRGVESFAAAHPGALLLFKRDAETVYIDSLNSGFAGSEAVLEEFLSRLTALPEVRPVTVGEYLRDHPPRGRVRLAEFLGNTRIETFTEGEAADLWALTVKVREKLLAAERRDPGSPAVKEAWEHLCLSHNSDGRIGYWHSAWNPGEHVVVPSRREFVAENLRRAWKALG
jgi:alpha-amylase/alpha-mannosidase (GH57 family)